MRHQDWRPSPRGTRPGTPRPGRSGGPRWRGPRRKGRPPRKPRSSADDKAQWIRACPAFHAHASPRARGAHPLRGPTQVERPISARRFWLVAGDERRRLGGPRDGETGQQAQDRNSKTHEVAAPLLGVWAKRPIDVERPWIPTPTVQSGVGSDLRAAAILREILEDGKLISLRRLDSINYQKQRNE